MKPIFGEALSVEEAEVAAAKMRQRKGHQPGEGRGEKVERTTATGQANDAKIAG